MPVPGIVSTLAQAAVGHYTGGRFIVPAGTGTVGAYGPQYGDPNVSGVAATAGTDGAARGRYVRFNEATQRWEYVGPRRRRRRLLSASDKADIAFLRGTLGGGELGRAAISAVLSRRQ